MKVSGWPGFMLWALVGVLYGIAYLGMMTIGIFILIVAVVTTIVAFRNLRAWPEVLGITAGPAVMMMRLASLNWNLRTCASGEQAHVVASASASYSMQSGSIVQLGQASRQILGCTSLDAHMLMYSGVGIAVCTLLAYSFLRYRPSRM